MSRRPRLVEEGLPLPTETDDNVEMDSDDMAMYSHIHHNNRHLYTIKQSSTQDSAPSSLSRALNRRSHDSLFMKHHHDQQQGSSAGFMEVDEWALDVPFYHDRNNVTNNFYDPTIQHHYTIGTNNNTLLVGDHTHSNHNRMEIEDITCKAPLLVLDGANIAYSYANTASYSISSSSHHFHKSQGPDVTGIRIAANYFLKVHFRVQIVIPSSWVRSKRHTVLHPTQLDILQELQVQQLLCFTPPTDDDDAYALAMARREDSRARLKKFNRSDGGPIGGAYLAFVVSNDFYRDAMDRDGDKSHLREWLEGCSVPEDKNHNLDFGPPGRISYSFCDLGSIDKYGSPIFDFVPNPRHALVEQVEDLYRKVPGIF